MSVYWRETAHESLREICWSLARHSTFAAAHAIQRIVERTVQLDRFPNSGREITEFEAENVRELIARPFRIWYVVQGSEVHIIGVFHGVRDLSRN